MTAFNIEGIGRLQSADRRLTACDTAVKGSFGGLVEVMLIGDPSRIHCWPSVPVTITWLDHLNLKDVA